MPLALKSPFGNDNRGGLMRAVPLTTLGATKGLRRENETDRSGASRFVDDYRDGAN